MDGLILSYIACRNKLAGCEPGNEAMDGLILSYIACRNKLAG